MKKIILILKYLLFIIGIILYCNNIINLFSSILLFLGGYLTIKNTLDYREVKKNIEIIKTIPKSNNQKISSKKIETTNINHNNNKIKKRVKKKDYISRI